MVFAPTVNANDTANPTLANLPFYPDLQVEQFRAVTRTQDSVTDKRVEQALRTAMIDTNRELTQWCKKQEKNGHQTLDDVPSLTYGAASELNHQYHAAVYAQAKATLLEQYRDIDTNGPKGEARAGAFESGRDGYLREAREAIRNILGRSHLTVELI